MRRSFDENYPGGQFYVHELRARLLSKGDETAFT